MDPRRLTQSIQSAAQFLLARQKPSGCWIDWNLPPGPSDMWTTAFVGHKLSCAALRTAPGVGAATRSAAHWLLNSILDDGGWGYNASVGSDSDTSAYSVLFLSMQECAVPAASYARLRQFQCPDGGFSTFDAAAPVGSWSASHPDVTPVVLLALLTRFSRDEPFVAEGIDYVLRERTDEGIWNSFWWNSFLYGTHASLTLLDALATEFDTDNDLFAHLADFAPSNAFEAALQLKCLSLAKAPRGLPNLDRLAARLLREQSADGSWPSRPMLRLTARTCFHPWRSPNSGLLFADANGVFTTSAVAEALASVFASR